MALQINQVTQVLTPEVLSAVVIPAVVAALKVIFERIPKWFVPIVAGFLGVIAQVLIALSTATSFEPLVGVAIGLLGVGIREFLKGISDKIKSIQKEREEE